MDDEMREAPGSARVLLVEDSRNMQSALVALLSSMGSFEVVHTAAGEQKAVAWLLAHPAGWDLALVDILLEDGSGIGFLRHCRNAHPDGRVVIFSEYASPGLEESCRALGADAVYLKSELPRLVRYLEAFTTTR